MLNSGHMAHGFLNELFQIKRRQLAGQDERATAVLDKNIAHSAAKMRMMF
jgi:hypothetical protein